MDWQSALDEITYRAIVTLGPIVLTALCLLIGVGISYLRAQLNRIRMLEQTEIDDRALKAAEDALRTAVQATGQTYVDTLKKAGKFDQVAQTEARRRALVAFNRLLPEIYRAPLVSLLGDLNTWAKDRLEAILSEQKLIQSSVTAAKVAAMADPKSSGNGTSAG